MSSGIFHLHWTPLWPLILLGALGMLGPLGLKSLICKMGPMSPSSVSYWEDKLGSFVDALLPGYSVGWNSCTCGGGCCGSN